MTKVILEREGYRFVEKGIIELNGMPDYRMQKQDYYSKRWNDIYLFDNSMQLTTAMEDIEYAKWLDPDRVPCYVRGSEEFWDQQSRMDYNSTGREQTPYVKDKYPKVSWELSPNAWLSSYVMGELQVWSSN